MRAEDFFRFILGLQQLRESFKNDLERVDRVYQTRSDFARSLAKMPAASSIDALEKRYGPEPGAKSHGEQFLALFQSRFVPGGLYLLDEPEAALSPVSQMGLINMIKEMVNQQAQFIIATHSPILMAYPDALIWNFDCLPPEIIAYDDVEHVRLYRSFLSDPQAFLRHL